jgi:tetratricopeptide (TPR) repeat protein
MSPQSSTPIVGKPKIDQPWQDLETVLRAAARAQHAGDLDRAHTLFERAIELAPHDARGWQGLAETAPTLDEKIARWGYALAITPNNLEARTRLGECVEEQLAQATPHDVPVLVNLGCRLAELGHRAPARRLLVRATQLDPQHVTGWLWRAAVTDDPDQALECLRHVLTLDPGNTKAKAGIAWILRERKKPRARPSDAESAMAQGHAAFQAGNLEQAHACFKRATEHDPENPEAWYWRGSTAPNTEQALAWMERALAIDPTYQAAREARWWLRIKKFREDLATRPSPPPLITPAMPMAEPDARRAPIAWILGLGALVMLIALILILRWLLGIL